MGKGSRSVKMRQRESRKKTLERRKRQGPRRREEREKLARQAEIARAARLAAERENRRVDKDLETLGELSDWLGRLERKGEMADAIERQIATLLRSLNYPDTESGEHGTALMIVCRALYKPGAEILIEDKGAKLNKRFYDEAPGVWKMQTVLDYVKRHYGQAISEEKFHKGYELAEYLRGRGAQTAEELDDW